MHYKPRAKVKLIQHTYIQLEIMDADISVIIKSLHIDVKGK